MNSGNDDNRETKRRPISSDDDDADDLVVEPDPSADLATMELGPWRLVRELGAGNMGTVWLAERADGAFRMNAAVKLIKTDMAGREGINRFLRERQILADLEHPHICRLLDGGTSTEGRPYLVMEFVDGLTLDRFCKQNPPSTPQLLQLFAKLCDALAFAHSRGVIHRDLKPNNIMVTPAGEPKLLDFGIAHFHDPTDQTLTQQGQMILTPSYASPEQWQGRDVGPPSDVFSLGAVLFELLTGWLPPMPGLHGVPPTRMMQAPLADTTLQTLILRALCDQPEARYPTADAFADALRDYLDAAGRPAARAARVFISCRGDVEDDVAVALEFYEAFAAAGAAPFLAPKNVAPNDNWVRAVNQALRSCDVFVLLLSQQAAVSQMVAAELELARQMRDRNAGTPHIVPVRVRFADDNRHRYPMREHLEDLEHTEWQGSGDTPSIVTALLTAIAHQKQRQIDPASGQSTAPSGKSPDPANQPNADTIQPELPGDIVDPNSPYYVIRPRVENMCLGEVVKPGALIRIKGPRQMGKTSLMRRLLTHAGHSGARTVAINLQLADKGFLGDLDRFLRWLCAVVSRQLKIPTDRIDDSWDDIFGAKDNCTAYFEDHVLPYNDALVLALDHVDRVFEFPSTAEEFLALLRAWNEMGKSQAPWSRLGLVLVYATEMYLPMNINRSPFNVGLPVALSEWDTDMVLELASRHGLSLGQAEVDRLMSVLSGHPHLIRVALHHLAAGMALAEVVDSAATDEGLFADHLKYLLWHLQTRPELGQAAAQVMASNQPIRLSTDLAFKLASLGLIRLQGNEVRPARELYRRYLQERLPGA